MSMGLIMELVEMFKLSKQALVLRFHFVINFGDLGIVHPFEGISFVFFHLNVCHLSYSFFYAHLFSCLRGRHSDQHSAFSKNGVFSQWVPAFKLSGVFPPKVRPFCVTSMLKVPALGPICRCLQFSMLNQWKRLWLVFGAQICFLHHHICDWQYYYGYFNP